MLIFPFKRFIKSLRRRKKIDLEVPRELSDYISIRHHASSAGRDQLPARPPLLLFNDQGPRGIMTQDSHRPEVIVRHRPLFPKTIWNYLELLSSSFASFLRCLQKHPEKNWWHQKCARSDTGKHPERNKTRCKQESGKSKLQCTNN